MDEELEEIVEELDSHGLLIQRDQQSCSITSLSPTNRLQVLAKQYNSAAYPSYNLRRKDINVKKILNQVSKKSKKAHKIARFLLKSQTTLLGKIIILSRGNENGVIDLSKRYLRLNGEIQESVGALLPYLQDQFIGPLETRFIDIRDELKRGLFQLANYDPEKINRFEEDIKRFQEKKDQYLASLANPEGQRALIDFIGHILYEDAFFVTKKTIDTESRRIRLNNEEVIDLFYHGVHLKSELDILEKSYALLEFLHEKSGRSKAFMEDALRSYEGISIIKSVSWNYRGMLESSVNISFEMLERCQEGQVEIEEIESKISSITRENLREYLIK